MAAISEDWNSEERRVLKDLGFRPERFDRADFIYFVRHFKAGNSVNSVSKPGVEDSDPKPYCAPTTARKIRDNVDAGALDIFLPQENGKDASGKPHGIGLDIKARRYMERKQIRHLNDVYGVVEKYLEKLKAIPENSEALSQEDLEKVAFEFDNLQLSLVKEPLWPQVEGHGAKELLEEYEKVSSNHGYASGIGYASLEDEPITNDLVSNSLKSLVGFLEYVQQNLSPANPAGIWSERCASCFDPEPEWLPGVHDLIGQYDDTDIHPEDKEPFHLSDDSFPPPILP